MLEETLGLRLAKDHAAADWSTRPLPETWLVYAALDVELLIELRAALADELAAAGKADWAAQEFEYERTRPPRPAKTDPWRRIPRAGRAVRSPRSLAVLRELWTTREELARELDLCPSKVLSHGALVAAALARPSSRRKMESLREFCVSGPGSRVQEGGRVMTALIGLHNDDDADETDLPASQANPTSDVHGEPSLTRKRKNIQGPIAIWAGM